MHVWLRCAGGTDLEARSAEQAEVLSPTLLPQAASQLVRTICTQTPLQPLTPAEMKARLEDEHRWYAQPPREDSLRNKAPLRSLYPYENRTEQVNRVIMSKIINCVKIAKGSGNTQGSHYHCVEVDLVNLHVAKTLFWGLPRTGPHMRGKKKCYNWEGKTEHLGELGSILAFQDHRLSLRKGQDAAIVRASGMVVVQVIPPFLVEHQEDKFDTQKLIISFYTAELNPRGVVTWPPVGIYNDPKDYAIVEQNMLASAYKMWRDLPQGETVTNPGITWHTMNWKFEKLAIKVRKARVPIDDEEDSEEEESVQSESDAAVPTGAEDSDEDESALLCPAAKKQRR